MDPFDKKFSYLYRWSYRKRVRKCVRWFCRTSLFIPSKATVTIIQAVDQTSSYLFGGICQAISCIKSHSCSDVKLFKTACAKQFIVHLIKKKMIMLINAAQKITLISLCDYLIRLFLTLPSFQKIHKMSYQTSNERLCLLLSIVLRLDQIASC